MIPPNDWELKKLLKIAIVFLTGLIILTALADGGVGIPVLTQVAGFAVISFIPGLMLLRILRVHHTGWIECTGYSVGLSLALAMFILAAQNIFLPMIGVTQPMRLWPVTITLSILTVLLAVWAYIRDKDYVYEGGPGRGDTTSLPAILTLILLPVMTILAVELVNDFSNNLLLIICLLYIACVVILAAFNKFINPPLYPTAIYVIALCLLYQTTLMSPYLVGSDIYAEYQFYHLVANAGYWDYAIASAVNSCLSITMLAPAYSLLMNIAGVWVFKAIYPLLFALVPLILYRIFSWQIDRRKAFLAAFFFMAVPTFSLEMIALCRQQVAELFLALLIMLLVTQRLHTWQKIIMGCIFAASIVVSHYATGFIGFIYMGLFLPFIYILQSRWFRSIWSWLCSKFGGLPPPGKQVHPAALWIIVAAFFLVGFAWYAYIASGVNLSALGWLWNKQTSAIASVATSSPSTPHYGFFNFGARDELVQTALGLDFFQVSPQGQLFRFFQLTTQLFLVLGICRLIFRPKGLNFTVEYLSLCVTSCLLLAGCIFLPVFANLLNTTRMYHITLITLAPFCILGGEVIWVIVTASWRKLEFNRPATTTDAGVDYRRYSAFITLVVLIPYFLFNSGLVYEVTSQDITDSIDTPYSIALSSYRLDLTGIFTQQDGAAAAWLSQNSNASTLLYTDQHAPRIVQFQGFPGQISSIPLDAGNLSPHNYIYFTRWNINKNELAFAMYSGLLKSYSGLRRHYSFKAVKGLIDAVNTRDIVYNNDGAHILAPVTTLPVKR
jgi:uncharacterized membrane protein